MKFIEIIPGIVVKKEAILAVLRTDNGCVIDTVNNSYNSVISYDSFIKLLEIEDANERLKARGEGSWGTQYWRG